MDCDFLSIKEFAAKVGVHPNTVRKSILKGRLAAFRIGIGKRASYRIAKTEIDRIALIDLEQIVNQLVEKKLQENPKSL